jgi:hypothetical protein
MKHSVLAFLLFIVFAVHLNARHLGVDIVSSAGGSAFSPQGIYTSWTIGDIIIAESKNSRKWILNGFQQGVLDTLRPQGDLDTLPALNIENIRKNIFTVLIYPNPVWDELNYKIMSSVDFVNITFDVSLIDLSGRVIWVEKNRKNEENCKRRMGNLNKGIYFLCVDIPRYKIKKTYKIIKR